MEGSTTTSTLSLSPTAPSSGAEEEGSAAAPANTYGHSNDLLALPPLLLWLLPPLSTITPDLRVSSSPLSMMNPLMTQAPNCPWFSSPPSLPETE